MQTNSPEFSADLLAARGVSKPPDSPGLMPFEAQSGHPLFEDSVDCVYVLDLEGRLHFANARGLDALGMADPLSLRGAPWIDFWREADRDDARAAVQAACAGRTGRFTGLLAAGQTSGPRWWDVAVSPIRNAGGRPKRLLATARDVSRWKRAEELLQAITEGTASVMGAEFFRCLVEHLARGLHVRFAFVAECLPELRARSLAFWRDKGFGPDFEYALPGTPCMEVAKGRVCHVPDKLPEAFPEDKGMISLGTVSYLGVPLLNSAQRIIGHLVIFDDKPMPQDSLVLKVMETFAGRAGVELEREQALRELERQKQSISAQLKQATAALAVSEERFRDLFDEAPIAYVHEGLDTRFIRVNRAAMRILGIRPEEVDGTYGKSFVPDTPEAQQRVQQALASIGRGTDTAGVVLELRRKDNGKPIWIQWWSRPDPSGTYTRTMFIDITERVLMEQEKTRLQAQNTYLREEIRTEHDFTEIVGNSPSLRDVLKQIEQIAVTDSTVLLLGETGTGKELIARAIHDRSRRRQHPLVKVNCGAISAGLVESELFGHVRGAFTGALANRDGRFKLADGGTIFLDEVGELPMDTQVKLLRVLQEQEFEAVGSGQTVRVNVRIIAATNRDLSALVSEGKFRSDLFYRLNVLPLSIPPLRERQGDVPLLVAFFVQRFAQRFGKPVKQASAEMMHRMAQYSWPGNIRELQNVIERAVVLSQSETLEVVPDLRVGSVKTTPQTPQVAIPSSTDTTNGPPPAEYRHGSAEPLTATATEPSLVEVERRHIESVLARTGWKIEGECGAATILKLSPSTLRSRMQKLGIKRPTRPS